MRWPGLAVTALGLVLGAQAAVRTASAQPYQTLAGEPDPRDFVHRQGTQVTLLGDAMRFMGYDIGRLGVQADGSRPSKPPTLFEIRDALATVQAMGGTVVRSRPIDFVPGCRDCARPTQAGPDPTALAELDMVLRVARDMGLKVIVPLAGSGTACATPAGDAICVYAQAHGAPGAAFFSDIAVRTDFLAGVATMLAHVDPMTGRATRDDPTILAWENCLGCGAGQNAGAVSAWSEQVGHAIKLVDPHHLYESGAFAGRIAPSAADPVPATIFATTSVDIVGDALATGSDVEVARTRLDAVANLVVSTGKPYVLDSIGWSPSIWKTPADLDLWLTAIVRQRNVTGALAGDLEGHEDAGGFLPAPPANPAAGVAALYFPGIRTADMDAAEMRVRGRALRRLAYGMADITILPAYLLPPKPEIIGAAGDRLTWRGSAGAERYTIERSPDPSALGSWTVVCDACVTDLSGGWQDKAVPAGPAWYRITPENINGHKSVPSDPIQATR